MKPKMLFILIIFSAVYVQAQELSTNEWNISPCMKYDAFYFINAISKDEFYNRMYPRDCAIWRGRLGDAIVDSIFTITNMTGSIGYKASHLFTYLPILTLDDLIDAFQDTARLRERIQSALVANKDQRYQASINDLNLLLPYSTKLISVFKKMKSTGWQEDWKALSGRLIADISRKQPDLTRYSPSFLREQVTRFLGIDAQQKDSSSTVYYLYYAFPNSFKLPYNMMATWNIEEPNYFFTVYLHEMLHMFSIYKPGLKEHHDDLLKHSPKFAEQRDILVSKLFESDDEFYILAAEAYLSVALGIRSDQEAIDYIKTSDGGTVLYSLMIYNDLQKSFGAQHVPYDRFIKDVFFRNVTPRDVEMFLSNTK